VAKKMKLGYKRCPKCEALVKGPRTRVCPKCSHEFESKQKKAPVPAPLTVAVEAPATKPANAVTIEQIRAVGQMVQQIGGFRRLHEMLGGIREVGGMKKFKELAEAMAVSES
jgi:hypothetical protein